ncbi:MAG: cation:proton antiporter [Firmicutes bacterium]|nr:cation:proton antiporter [Bacillota bacterium]
MSHLLQLLALTALVITASKAGGALSKRIGQPAVFGELLVGLLLGPTLINLLHFFPDPGVHAAVTDFAEIGVIFLMFLAGLETDLPQMRKVGAAAFVGAAGGVILPMAAGYAIALAFGYPHSEAIFIGTVLTATSVSISAQTLFEMKQLRTKEGSTILGAAVIDDVMGLLVLSIVVALYGTGAGAGTQGGGSILLILAKVILYIGAGIGLGYVVRPLLRKADNWPGSEVLIALAVAVGLLYAFTAEHYGGMAPITGAYLAGIVIGQEGQLKHQITEKLSVIAYGFFVPIFFVSIGLEANARQALAGGGLAFTLWIVVAAVVTKVIGSGLGVKAVGFTWPESLRVGTGMISRGEVALIVAGIGLSSGVIGPEIFAAMVLMTLATTLVTPLLLRVVFKEQAAAH